MNCVINQYGMFKGLPTAVLARVMAIAACKAVDMYIPVSNEVALKSGLVAEGKPYRVIPNFLRDKGGIEGEYKSYTAQLPDEDYLLFVGALARNKGVDVLLRAYAEIANAPPLVLIGYETEIQPSLLKEVTHNVTVLKNWPHEAVLLAWRRSLMGLIPSVWPEPFGIVALEAMASGLPLIASRIGGLTDIIVDGETGILVPPGNVIALKHAIEHLMANPDIRMQMGKAGRERVSAFRANQVVRRYEQVYEELIEV
jgi:glycosyltransferase involved in cell wall biosynthesis